MFDVRATVSGDAADVVTRPRPRDDGFEGAGNSLMTLARREAFALVRSR